MLGQFLVKPNPVNEEVAWDKSRTISSTTDKYGIITDVNQTFCDVCGYAPQELLGKSHNVIRHPDMPKIIFKITWDNILSGRNFHAILKNLSKSGKYYWVITDFEVNKNILGDVISIVSKRKSVPDSVIKKHIEPLYQTLSRLEKVGGVDLSGRYFKGLLEKQGKTYIDYLHAILDEANGNTQVPNIIDFQPTANANANAIVSKFDNAVDVFNNTTNSQKNEFFFDKLFEKF